MVFGESHIFRDLFLDKNPNDNAYSKPLLYEALDVEHKMLMLLIGLFHNKFSHLCMQHHHYPEHDTLFLSILFHWLFFYIFPDK